MNITSDDLIEIHEILVDWFAASEDPVAPPGVRDRDLLASAAARPWQTLAGADAYPTIFNKAAALFHSFVNNHPFHTGNKRVALISAQVLLAEDNYCSIIARTRRCSSSRDAQLPTNLRLIGQMNYPISRNGSKQTQDES